MILLGLVAFFARGRTMYNIDFTGGTLVTIRLNEADPTVQSLVRVEAGGVRPREGERPARRHGREPPGRPATQALARFNIRTDRPGRTKQVKNKILEAFGPSSPRSR